MAKKILAVDDELDILKIVAFRFKKAGYEVIEAVDGQKAMDLIKAQNPDLVILDLRLPILDGWEVCRRIKGSDEFKSTPVILLSASAGTLNLETMKELKADDYLLKPFEPEVLLEKVKRFIG